MRYVLSLKLTGFAAVMTAVLSVLVVGCGGDGTTQPPPVNEFAPPTGLTVVNGSGEVFLSWQASSDAADSDFKGYNVYRHTSTMVGATDAQLLVYKLNSTVITSTDYHDGTAVNGYKYYYAVRAMRGSSELSTPTSEYDTAPRWEGTADVELGEFKNTTKPSGLNCAAARAYAMESSPPNDNHLLIDCYLGTMGNNDEITYHLALKSPDRVLNGSSAIWSTRRAELVLLGTEPTDWETANAPATGWANQVDLGDNPVGKVIAVRTPGGTGVQHYAKVMITQVVNGTEGQRVITATVAYQGIADYPRFVAGR